MFSSQVRKDLIHIHPRDLCKDIKQKILEALRKSKNRTITPQQGVILNVYDIISYGTPMVKNSSIISYVEYQASLFFPSVGEVYTGCVTLVLPVGLLLEEEGLVKVLIQPLNMPPGYKFDGTRKVFSNGIHSFGIGSSVRFKITNFRYKPEELSCIGSIKDIIQTPPECIDEIIEPEDPFND
jgi:DNA-directed RNA polymerase subunit E'/Rpb7